MGAIINYEDNRAIDHFCDGSSGAPALEKAVFKTAIEAFKLWQARQRKYGPGNIQRHGAVGCLIRGDDKSARLAGVYIEGKPSDTDPKDTVEDAWIDKINYAVMGLMCHRGEWPGVKPYVTTITLPLTHLTTSTILRDGP